MTNKSLPEKLLSIQKKIRAVTKSSSNPHFRSKYADLNATLDVAKPALNEEGLFVAQGAGKDAFGQYVETSIIDAVSGQQIQGRVYFSGNEDNMQKIGAAITYGRRFGLVSLLALESEDDDGETAVGRGNEKAVQERSIPTPRPNPEGAGKVPEKAPPVRTEVPSGPSRETVLKKISLTSKVILDSKRASQEDVFKMLTAYGVTHKDELNDVQAQKLLSQLEEKLK